VFGVSPGVSCALSLLLSGLAACGGGEGGASSDGAGGGGVGGGGGAAGCALAAATVVEDQPYASIAGVEPSLLSLDYYSPARTSCAPVPIVVWIHGGAWALGDKKNGMPDKVALVNGEGWLLVSVNYRLSPSTPSNEPDRVMYPDHPTDVAAALAWVRSHGSEIGGDVKRMAILGHSAGAHLAALVATDASFLEANAESLSSLRCVGSFDTEAYDVPESLASASAQQQQILENAFGTDPAVQALASPVTHVVAGQGIPAFLIATRGTATRKAIQESFRQALEDAGVDATTIDATGFSHEEVQSQIGAAGDTLMTPPIVDFLRACLK
jgi:arylformamidase